MRIGFLGTGRMGAPMAVRLLRQGHAVRAWDPHGRAERLVEKGLPVVATPEDAVAQAEVVVAMMDPDEGIPVLTRLVPAIPPGALLIDAATAGPQRVRAMAELLAGHGIRMVDAPAVGRPADARRGRLAVFMGGSEEDVAAAMAVVSSWADRTSVFHVGGVGSGNALRLVHNVTVAIASAAVGEALRISADLGLDRTLTLDSFTFGPFAFTVSRTREELVSGDVGNVRLSLDRVAREVALALDAATRDLPMVRACLEEAEEAVAAGHGGDDIAALTLHIEREGHVNSL